MLEKFVAIFGTIFFAASVMSDTESDVKNLRQVICDNENGDSLEEFSKCLEIYKSIEEEPDPGEECFSMNKPEENKNADESDDFYCSLELEKVVQMELCAEFKRKSAENGKILLDAENRFRICVKEVVEKYNSKQ